MERRRRRGKNVRKGRKEKERSLREKEKDWE